LAVSALTATGGKPWKLLKSARQKLALNTPQDSTWFGLIVFAILVGIPAALGLIQADVIWVLGALMACMLGRRLLEAKPFAIRAKAQSPSLWFLALGFNVLAAGAILGTFSLQQGMSIQAIFGPAPLLGPASKSIASSICFIFGLVAASFWCARLPSLPGGDESVAVEGLLQCGECSLAGAVVGAAFWGAPLGAVLLGPSPDGISSFTGLSILVTVISVAVVSAGRRIAHKLPALPALIACLSVGIAGIATGVLVK